MTSKASSGSLRGPFCEKCVDPLGCLQGHPKSRTWFGVKQERDVAELHIRIQNHGMATHRHAKITTHVRRQSGRPRASTHAGENYEAAALGAVGYRRAAGDDRTKTTGHFVTRQWLRQVILKHPGYV